MNEQSIAGGPTSVSSVGRVSLTGIGASQNSARSFPHLRSSGGVTILQSTFAVWTLIRGYILFAKQFVLTFLTAVAVTLSSG
jgi:hypothetical protein